MSGTSTAPTPIPKYRFVASKWNSGIDISTLSERDISRALKGLRTASNILSTSGRPRDTALTLIENLESGSGNVSKDVDWEACARLEGAINRQSKRGFLNSSFTDFVDKATGRKDVKRIHPKTALRERLRRAKRLSTSATSASSSAAHTETRHLAHEDLLVEQQGRGEDEHGGSEYLGPYTLERPTKASAEEPEESDDESSWEGCSAVGDDADGTLEATSAPTQSSELPGITGVEDSTAPAKGGGATRWKSGIDLSNLTLTKQELSSLKTRLHKASNILYPGWGPQATASKLLENLENQPHNVSEGIEWKEFLHFKYALKHHGKESLAYTSVCTFHDKLKEHDKAMKRGEKETAARQQRRLQPGSTYGSQRGVRKRRQKGSSTSTNHAVSSSPDLSQTNTIIVLEDGSDSESDGAEEPTVSWSREECDSLLKKMKEYIKPAVRSVPVRLVENLEEMMTTGSGDLFNNIEWGQYTNWRNSASNTKSQLLKDILHGLDSQLVKPATPAPKPKSSRQLRSLIPTPTEPRVRPDHYFDPLWERGITLRSLGLEKSEIIATTLHLDRLTCEDKPDSQRRITATSLITNLFCHQENITHNIAGEDYRALIEQSGVSQGPISELRERVRVVLSGSCYCQSGHGFPPSPPVSHTAPWASPPDSHIAPWASPPNSHTAPWASTTDTHMMDVEETTALPWGVVDSAGPRGFYV